MYRLMLSITLVIAPLTAVADLPALPEPVTSFGAAVAGNQLYVYGGHTGDAHSYSVDEQSGRFLRLNLAEPAGWEELPAGPKLQGLALVSHDDTLYRIGGFTAKNAAGKDHELHSQSQVASFDPDSGQWTDETPLPEPRSSFDAAVLGDRLYVVGGWQLAGERDSTWHATAWSADLTKSPLTWEKIAAPPAQHRALALSGHDGRIYAIGGMSSEGPTRATYVFDPRNGTWTGGPDLLGNKPIDGFGAAARSTESGLYVSSLGGIVQRLSDDGSRWEVAGSLDAPRFFHQMVPYRDGLLLVGGANMTDGKLPVPEFILPTRPASIDKN